MAFTKLHASIVHSSIWQESHPTRIVWITMLALADEYGIVGASVGGLARAANVKREECEAALQTLISPDPDSRDGTTGERIEKVQGGWLILNHAAYREKQTRSQALAAERTRRWRTKKEQVHAQATGDDRDVTERHEASPSDLICSDLICSDLDSEESPEESSPRKPKPLPEGFAEFYDAFKNKQGREAAIKAWRKLKPKGELLAKIMDRARAYRAACVAANQIQKHPATWLNGRGWEDEELPKPMPVGASPNGRYRSPGFNENKPEDYRKPGTDWIEDI